MSASGDSTGAGLQDCAAMPPPTRQTFQQQLDAVEEELQNHARLVMRALDRAMQALLAGDEQLADMVIAEDDENDATYARIEDAWSGCWHCRRRLRPTCG